MRKTSHNITYLCRISFVVLLFIGYAATSYSQESNITIKGKIEGIKEGRLHLIARIGEENYDTLGSCDFKKGKFELKATAIEPMVTTLIVEGYSGGFTLLAEPGKSYKAHLSNDRNHFINGGTLNELYKVNYEKSDSMRAVITDLRERYNKMRENRKFRSASLINDTIRQEQQRLKDFTDKFLAENDNLITAYTILSNIEMGEAGLQETKALYASMGESAKATHCGRIIKERIERLEKNQGGASAPDFTLIDINSNEVTMSAVEGKIKIIDFWASWCGPCRLNNPDLKKLYEEFHSKGLEIIGVSLDNKKNNWQMAVEKDGLNWINVSSLKGWKCEVAKLYNVTSVPALFILDNNNNIIATGLRGEQLKTFLQEKLK